MVQTALYALVLLWAVAECVRAMIRLDLVVFHGYVTLGEVTLMPASDPRLLHLNTWPPFFEFVAVGIALLARVSEHLALALWQLIAFLATWGCCKLSAQLFLGDDAPMGFWPRDPTRFAFGSSALVVPFLMTARLFQEHAQHTQVNVQVVFLVLLAFHWFRRSRVPAGGAALALAVSLKATPLVFLLYLGYRRAWRPLAWTVAFLVFLNVVLPVAAFGPERAAHDFTEWRAVAQREIREPVAEFRNQSLLAALKRGLTTAGSHLDPVHYAVADLSDGAVRGVFYGLAGLALAFLAWRFRGPGRSPGLTGPVIGAEIAIGLGAMTVIDPLAWKAHYVTLIVLYTFVWWALGRRAAGAPGAAWRWALWWVSFACLTFSAPALIGGRGRNVVESVDVILVGALALIALAISLLPEAERAAQPEAARATR